MPKDIQYLSKRRRNQLIKHFFNNESVKEQIDHNRYSEPLQTFISSVPSNVIKEVANTLMKCDKLNESSISLEHEVECNKLKESQFYAKSHKEHNSELQNSIPDFIVDSNSNHENSLREDLQILIIQRNMQHTTANELLRILRKHGHIELPSDVRFSVRTPRNASVNIQSLSNGHYVHFGLVPALERSIQMYSKFIITEEIKLNVNIDGLPISKSSGSQFWPIMASIADID